MESWKIPLELMDFRGKSARDGRKSMGKSMGKSSLDLTKKPGGAEIGASEKNGCRF
jgi:hypothetical protein